LFGGSKQEMVAPSRALTGRSESVVVPDRHLVLGTPLVAPFPEGIRVAYFALGCFWGAEKMFWSLEGVYSTAAGYAGGFTPNPTYEEVCSAKTGHAETVLVAYDPSVISYEALLKAFYEEHDPTQYMRQGNDVGTQYRSAIFVTNDDERRQAEAVTARFGEALRARGYGEIVTEIVTLGDFYYAEDYHQQYLAANPNGYCPVHATGVSCPVGTGVEL
jgi:peptide-methionine (S)-S-oxide reductase